MSDFPKPSLTADALVLAGSGEHMDVLVIERKNPPFRGKLALPGGFVDPYEHPLQACVRELEEETGLALPPHLGIALSLRTQKGRDPRGWTLSQPYLFLIPEKAPVRAGDDAGKTYWQPLQDLENLAFDHGAMLCEGLGKLWRGMPTFQIKVKAPRPFGAPDSRVTGTTFFGGSFNPWHEGHRACVELCPHREELIVVPDANPFKGRQNPGCAWYGYRAICRKIGDLGVRVFPGFCGMEIPNPTAHWFPAVRGSHKGLLLGEDSFASLPTWLEAARLARSLHHVYVAPRRASTREIEETRVWLLERNPHCRILFLDDHPFRDLSATAIRRQAGH